MPNLPGSSIEKDTAMFERMLLEGDLQADQWKIYPCEIVPWTVIKKWFEQGTYVPYGEDELAEVRPRATSRDLPRSRASPRDLPSPRVTSRDLA